MKHIPWDNGTLTYNPLFKAVMKQKTVKTWCNKRVKFSSSVVTPSEADCPQCLAEYNDHVKAAEAARRYLDGDVNVR